MTTLNDMLERLSVTKKDCAALMGVNRTVISLLAQRGIWPANEDVCARLRSRLSCWLLEQGFSENEVGTALGEPRSGAFNAASRAPKALQWGVDSPAKQKTPQSADFGRPVKTPVEWPSDAQKQTGRDESRPYNIARSRKPHSGDAERFIAPEAGTQPAQTFIDNEEEMQMLLKNETLTAQARQFFKIPRSPFLDDVNCEADVFCTPETEYVRAVLFDAAMSQGFVAVIGESGSGKTTLREELEERCRAASRPVVIIKPYVLEMEASERTGTVLRSGQISEAIVHALDPAARVMRSAQARARQVHRLLTASAEAGNNHLLIIEEAHRMPAATLRHLKGFMEMKAGLRRLLGVALIGQPELHYLLNEHRADLREIVQRCAKVQMPPLDADLEGYIKHKFSRVGVDASAIFNQAIVDAIRTRLVYVPRGGQKHEVRSVCYPLIVNNLIIRAMNAAARVGMALSPDVIKEC